MTKKSWHTANFSNVEKVWAIEQKEKNEQAKLEALAKELKQEREMEELRRIQGKAGLATKVDGRLSWMYQGPSGPSSEEYLLGKEYKEEKSAVKEEVEQFNKAEGSLFVEKKVNQVASLAQLASLASLASFASLASLASLAS
jgi:hypothetical protein